jgi:hypothetical protein
LYTEAATMSRWGQNFGEIANADAIVLRDEARARVANKALCG